MNIEQKSVNAIRVLAADTVQKANSGHPGMPLGSAAMAYELWANHLTHNPKNPKWVNRDRFILSAGHASSLLYSLLHLFGYGLTIEDMKNFRQDNSLTPGHPEYGHTVGVEATTGPLGAGMGMAVGMAMAQAHMAATFNTEDYNVIDHYTFVLGGDGCMEEGISSEAFSLAGTLGLSKLIVLYDSNNITIEGNTDLAFTEDVNKRMEAFGFQTLTVEDGNNLEEISKAIELAKSEKTKPSFITVKTKIAFGCPAKEGSESSHGSPLGEENVKALRDNLGWEEQEAFVIPQDVYDNFAQKAKKGQEVEDNWNKLFKAYCEKYPEKKELWDKYFAVIDDEKLLNCDEFWSYEDKPQATRSLSGNMINRLAKIMPNFWGGSADLGPSNKTVIKDGGSFSKNNYLGRNIHYGVREFAMAAIANGITLYGGTKTFVGTFFVFSDYLKPMARLAALMKIPVTYVLTHDSIGVGEDGPTHEPIEQLAMLRAMPNINVFRPADATETAAAWYSAITSKNTPTVLALSRQNLPQIEGSSKEALKGGYIIAESIKAKPDAIIIASGSEVSLAVDAKKELMEKGFDIRVVSMPCMDIFEQQSDEYKEKILPQTVEKRLVVEAGSSICWGKYLGFKGKSVTIDTFGASAPANVLFKKYGFTVENVVNKALSMLK
ncbi:transketolase [Megamonas funiformis]|uniref:Transketolase n=1 Tax=Megamonas funiformis YIT 11815 TaxID=742816 RepID=A0ABP2NK49_9FIRM|nr:transketolase [Megamonas funiformis]EHR37367.1 transketolase [Megamonas funiformis YIT 11815]QIB59576.1 transketolase [Megamonas funiformis]